MSNIIPFNYENKEIRTIQDENNELWVVAKDLAEALGYKWNGSSRVAHIPEEWKGVTSVVTPGGLQDITILSEQGVYFFLCRSDKPKAIPLQKWIAGEVLPTIRKTGSYTSPTASLPVYTPDVKTTFSASDLLKKNDCPMSAAAFNKLLVANGFLEERERTASKGRIKRFKALTEAGLKYGQNDASKHNPRAVHPHYFEDSFMDLFTLVTQGDE